jgi:hypothetical protein
LTPLACEKAVRLGVGQAPMSTYGAMRTLPGVGLPPPPEALVVPETAALYAEALPAASLARTWKEYAVDAARPVAV